MADSIPAAYKGKIKFVENSISQNGSLVNKENFEPNDIESEFYNARVKYSSRVAKHIFFFKIDGKKMTAKVNEIPIIT